MPSEAIETCESDILARSKSTLVDDELMQQIRTILKKFELPSNHRGIMRIAVNILIILISSLAYTIMPRLASDFFRVLLYLAAVIVIGGRFRGLESCTHEATHYTLFKTRSWNRRLQFLYAWPLLEQVQAYSREHMLHHAKLGRDDDPAFRLYDEMGVLQFPKKFYWVMVVRPLLGYHTLWMIREKIAYCRHDIRFAFQMALFWSPIFLIVTLTGSWRWFILFYALPLLVVFPALLILSEVTDHASLYRDCPLRLTRNNVGPLQNLFLHAHDDGYHLVHHLNPRIPVHCLRAAHASLMHLPKFRSLCVHSRGFLQTLQQLQRPLS